VARKAKTPKPIYYKIGEACKELDIQPYVLRYWETEFPALNPNKSKSGQRVYTQKELDIIRRIKELLYDEGYTIAGAKKKLESELAEGHLGESPKPKAGKATEQDSVEQATEAPKAAEATQPSLDTESAEKVETLRHGVREALTQAREILGLLS
jgi:DNA-binding transcriptional MerR regulator